MPRKSKLDKLRTLLLWISENLQRTRSVWSLLHQSDGPGARTMQCILISVIGPSKTIGGKLGIFLVTSLSGHRKVQYASAFLDGADKADKAYAGVAAYRVHGFFLWEEDDESIPDWMTRYAGQILRGAWKQLLSLEFRFPLDNRLIQEVQQLQWDLDPQKVEIDGVAYRESG